MVTTVSPPPKTAEPMEMPFREKTRVGPRNRVLYGGERWQHQANTTDWILLLYQNTIDLFLIKQETWLPEAVGAIETHTEISSNCRPEVHRYIIDWKVSLMIQKDIWDCTGRYKSCLFPRKFSCRRSFSISKCWRTLRPGEGESCLTGNGQYSLRCTVTYWGLTMIFFELDRWPVYCHQDRVTISLLFGPFTSFHFLFPSLFSLLSLPVLLLFLLNLTFSLPIFLSSALS